MLSVPRRKNKHPHASSDADSFQLDLIDTDHDSDTNGGIGTGHRPDTEASGDHTMNPLASRGHKKAVPILPIPRHTLPESPLPGHLDAPDDSDTDNFLSDASAPNLVIIPKNPVSPAADFPSYLLMIHQIVGLSLH